MIAGPLRIWQAREPHIAGVNETVKMEKLVLYKLRSLSSWLSCHGRPRFWETKANDVVPLVQWCWFPFPDAPGVPSHSPLGARVLCLFRRSQPMEISEPERLNTQARSRKHLLETLEN